MSKPYKDSSKKVGWSNWLADLSGEIKIVIAVLAGLILLLSGLLLGLVVGRDSTDPVAGATETSSLDTEPADVPTSSTAAVTTAVQAPATASASSTPVSTTLATPTTTSLLTSAPSPSSTAMSTTLATTTTTSSPTTTTAPTTTTTTALTTTTTTVPITVVTQGGVEIEAGQAIDLDTGATYTITTNPDFFDPVLAAAVDVKLDEVLLAASGYNVVVSPLNGAVVTKNDKPNDSCNPGTGTFGSIKVFVHFDAGEFDSYYCFVTSDGNFSLMVPLVVTGTQNPVGFVFATAEPPGIP